MFSFPDVSKRLISSGRYLRHRYAAAELQFKVEVSRDDIVHKQLSAVYHVLLRICLRLSLYGEESCVNYYWLAHPLSKRLQRKASFLI